jgi:hypothetical protein
MEHSTFPVLADLFSQPLANIYLLVAASASTVDRCRSGDFMITGDNGAQDAMLDAAFQQAEALKIQVHGARSLRIILAR